jgi:hypothetical protein
MEDGMDWLNVWQWLGYQYALNCGYEVTAIDVEGMQPGELPTVRFTWELRNNLLPRNA